ncbi:Ig-like domain-containing protein [Pseudoduganella violacea]|uniref:DUF4347 domain-containing protein n=1 Tax=Pseudoduganella violacea TaxID=1715466 RepID=A0A7W5FSN3_9BURK|nr:Ig-like domain-containing protein [Pseudoduganella violacea]MBB3117726.1 hypothetical protein [Pseudoduganella violacea]
MYLENAQDLLVIDADIALDRSTWRRLGRHADLLRLRPDQNGLEQIAHHLESRPPVRALHLLSHGAPGRFHAGATALDLPALERQAATLRRIAGRLAGGASVLLYGCCTGAGRCGQTLVRRLADLLQAPVAAATGLTGAAQRGGTWRLDRRSGPIAARVLDAGLMAGFDGVLAAPADQNYDANGGYSATADTFTLNGVKYTVTGTNPGSYTNIVSNNSAMSLLGNNAGDYFLFFDLAGAFGISSIKIEAADGSAFDLDGLSFDAAADVNISITPQGGSAVSYSSNGALILQQNVSFAGNNAFKNITSFTFSGGNLALALDDLNFSPASVAVAAPTGLTLAVASDSGTLGDNLTNDTTPTITGSAPANSTVTLYDSDGTTVLGSTTSNGSGAWSITSTALTGAHTLTAKTTDGSSNVSAASVALNITIDASAPSAATALALASASDSGTLGDNITSDNTPTISGSAEANAAVTLYDSDGTTVLGSTTANGSGAWNITSSALSNGTHTVTVKQTDAAGNTSPASAGLSLSIDTSTPAAPPLPALATASDSGTLGDLITNDSTPTVTGTGTAGHTVTLYDSDGSTVLGTATVAGNGSWSITSSALGDGTHNLTVKQATPAGTASAASAALSLLIDTTAPAAPAALALAGASDSGTVGDNITNDTTPTINGTAAAHAAVTLYDSDGTTVLGTATADGSGNWSITSSALSDGSHTLRAKQTDSAGNVSAASTGLSLGIYGSIGSVTGLALASGSDSGTAGDNITNVTTPTLSGNAAANATVTLYDSDGTTVLGSTTANGSGAWSITSAALGNGTHTLTVKQSDAAGNVSAAATLPVKIDTLAPSALSLSASSVSTAAGLNGTVGTLGATDATSGDLFTYALVAGSGDSGNSLFNIAGGSLRINDAAATALGSQSVRIKVTDSAGNTYEQVFAIQVVAPSTPPPTNPPTTVDGVEVSSAPVVLPGGGMGTAVTIPIVPATRTDSNNASTMADIPLVSANSTALLTAHLPAGVGLVASGGPSKPAGNSLDELIAAILATTPNNAPADRSHLTGNGSQFLDLLADNVPLQVERMVFSRATDASATTLAISGAANAAQHTALVIDATSLPSGSTINLQDVHFAALIGAVRATGSTAGQILTGDAASQQFSVSASNGVKVYGGGGDDMMQFAVPAPATPQTQAQSRAPQGADEPRAPTLLNGGLGTDTASFLGKQADYLVRQYDGYVSVSSLAAPAQRVDLLNVEKLQFADATLTLEHRPALDLLAALYANVLGRQSDVGGFNFWGAVQSEGRLDLGGIALQMITSPEGLTHGYTLNGTAQHDLDTLYQAIFKRAPDAGGLAFWLDKMEHGISLAVVAEHFLQSTEMSGHARAEAAWDFYF